MALDKSKFEDRQLIELIYDEIESIKVNLINSYATKAEVEKVRSSVKILEKNTVGNLDDRVNKIENIMTWAWRLIGGAIILAVLSQVIVK